MKLRNLFQFFKKPKPVDPIATEWDAIVANAEKQVRGCELEDHPVWIRFSTGGSSRLVLMERTSPLWRSLAWEHWEELIPKEKELLSNGLLPSGVAIEERAELTK